MIGRSVPPLAAALALAAALHVAAPPPMAAAGPGKAVGLQDRPWLEEAGSWLGAVWQRLVGYAPVGALAPRAVSERDSGTGVARPQGDEGAGMDPDGPPRANGDEGMGMDPDG